jgi:hypothetical protein
MIYVNMMHYIIIWYNVLGPLGHELLLDLGRHPTAMATLERMDEPEQKPEQEPEPEPEPKPEPEEQQEQQVCVYVCVSCCKCCMLLLLFVVIDPTLLNLWTLWGGLVGWCNCHLHIMIEPKKTITQASPTKYINPTMFDLWQKWWRREEPEPEQEPELEPVATRHLLQQHADGHATPRIWATVRLLWDLCLYTYMHIYICEHV